MIKKGTNFYYKFVAGIVWYRPLRTLTIVL